MGRMIDGIVERGEIGGRTVQILETGEAECGTYPAPQPKDGQVLVKTVRSAISPGTEMTFYGKDASNVHLHKTWDNELRIFRPGAPSMEYPVTFGYRASGEVVESRVEGIPVGTRVYGSWRHTEFTLRDASVGGQRLPVSLSHDDGVDIAQMGPICVNAVAFGEGQHNGHPAVVFGAGPVGLIAAQVVRATGASVVYVVDRLPNRLAIADSLGFVPIDASGENDVAYQLKKEHGSEGIPVAFECTGSTHALNEAIRVVKRRGIVVAAGFFQGEGKGLILGDEFHHNGVQVICGQIGNIHPAWSWHLLRQRTIELAVAGGLVLGGLPRTTLPVERVAEGFAALTRPIEHLQTVLTYE